MLGGGGLMLVACTKILKVFFALCHVCSDTANRVPCYYIDGQPCHMAEARGY